MMRRIFASSLLAALVACGTVTTAPDAAPDVDTALGPDAPTDATEIDGPPPIDAPIDAPPLPPTPPFDVAYTSIWDIKGTTGVGAGSTGVIINRGTTALDMTTLQIVAFTDDHPTINFNYSSLNAATYLLPPNNSGGSLSPAAANLINPMVPEPRFDSNRPTLDFVLNMIPSPIPTVTVNATATIRIGNQQAVVPMRFNVAPTGSVAIIAAARVSSTPVQ